MESKCSATLMDLAVLQAAPDELKLAQVCVPMWTCTAVVHLSQPGQSLCFSSVKSSCAYRAEVWPTYFRQKNLRVWSQANCHLKGRYLLPTSLCSLCSQWQLLLGSRELLWFISPTFYTPPHLSHCGEGISQSISVKSFSHFISLALMSESIKCNSV